MSTVIEERQRALEDAWCTSQRGTEVTKGKLVSLIPLTILQNETLRVDELINACRNYLLIIYYVLGRVKKIEQTSITRCFQIKVGAK